MRPLSVLARLLSRPRRHAPVRPKLSPKLTADPLEPRDVPSGVRSIDGSGNNVAHPTWGQAGTDFLRLAPAAYADGVSAPAGANRPSARAVSNAVDAQNGQDLPNDRYMSAMVYAWGQFIDHDLDLTQSGTGAFDIPVPAGDSVFDPTGTGTQVISMTRSGYDPATGTTTPRQQVNTITAWLDGSMVYGSDAATAASLRTMTGGQMKTSAGNLLPTDASGFFLAGDVRANENPELTSLQTLFVREHNRVATQIAAANPTFTDEQIYQKARAWVIAEIEAITYNEWLPALVGSPLAPYAGYNANVNPGISNEFATAAFRFGHSLVGGDIEFLDNNGNAVAPAMSFADAFFNPSAVQGHGIDPLLKYLASDPSQEFDPKVVDELRNMLLTVPGSTVRLDLAALNIQRGRDHGLSDYNTTRAALGLPRVTSFAQISSNPNVQAALQSVYGTVDKIDLWVGALAENHVPGGSVGPTVKAILGDQFGRLRAGDRFWYENTFTGSDLATLRNTHLSDLIKRNTTDSNIQPNVFVFKPEVIGTVTGGNHPAPGLRVWLVNADGEVAATTTTDAQGRFHFGVLDGLGTGVYSVRVALPNGTVVNGPTVSVTRGDSVVTANVMLPPPPGGPVPPPPHFLMTTAAPVHHHHLVVTPPLGFAVDLSGTELVLRPRG